MNCIGFEHHLQTAATVPTFTLIFYDIALEFFYCKNIIVGNDSYELHKL